MGIKRYVFTHHDALEHFPQGMKDRRFSQLSLLSRAMELMQNLVKDASGSHLEEETARLVAP